MPTPRFTLPARGSALKASVRPRIGSLGAISTAENIDEVIAVETLLMGRSGTRAARCAATSGTRKGWIFGEAEAIMTVLPQAPRTLVQMDFRGDRARFVLPEKPARGDLCDATKNCLAALMRHCGTTLKNSVARCRSAPIRTSSA